MSNLSSGEMFNLSTRGRNSTSTSFLMRARGPVSSADGVLSDFSTEFVSLFVSSDEELSTDGVLGSVSVFVFVSVSASGEGDSLGVVSTASTTGTACMASVASCSISS